MKTSGHNYKLSDEEFLNILRDNGRLFSITAKAIRRKYGIPYSRQAVRDRAQKHPEFLRELEEANLETAHFTFLELMKQKKDMNIRFKAAWFYAQTKGKAEFNMHLEVKPQQELKEQVIKIGKRAYEFLTPWKDR